MAAPKMSQLTHRNGTVVTVADDRVDRLLRAGFTRTETKKAPAKKAPAKKASAQTGDK
jgi:hypothetical protein